MLINREHPMGLGNPHDVNNVARSLVPFALRTHARPQTNRLPRRGSPPPIHSRGLGDEAAAHRCVRSRPPWSSLCRGYLRMR